MALVKEARLPDQITKFGALVHVHTMNPEQHT